MGGHSSIFLCFVSAVGCQVVTSMTFTDLLAFATGTPYEDLPRLSIQLIITLAVLLPLCLLPSLKPLAAASLFGVCGTSATALCIVVRWLDGSYAPEGDYFEEVQWTPAFSQRAPATTGAERLPKRAQSAWRL